MIRTPEPIAVPGRMVQHETKDSISSDSTMSRRSSNSSYMSNYSNSTAPSFYSPTSSGFFRTFRNNSQPTPKFSSPTFKQLPQEVYDCILAELQSSHTGQYTTGCPTCFLRDLTSLALTSRAWERAVRGRLYNSIHIIGPDSPSQLKKYKLKKGSRMTLLRRTLRERKLLANLVLELRVPDLEPAPSNAKQNAQYSAQLQEFRDLVASVVMVCPNLERLVGFTIPYNHEYDRLSHALSTRKKLKEHTWVISENIEVAERARRQAPPGLLDPLQTFQFLQFHASWTELETLMLHSLDSRGIMEHGLFLRMFNLLPSLKHLSVSSFDAEDFTDRTLLFLPPLVSLRLENLPGLTDNGLAHYTSREEARTLRSLTLIEQNMNSLLAISKILACLTRLETFNLVQTKTAPTIPTEGVIFQPLLASSSLKHIHWDVTSPNPHLALSKLDSGPFSKSLKNVDTPNSHLAQSITHAGFPCLRSLRAPQDIDPPGALQAVCRPARHGQVLLPNDRSSLPRSSHGSMHHRPMTLPGGNNLTCARIRAQSLIDMAARDRERFGVRVIITDHSDSYVPDSAMDAPEDEERGPDIDDYFEDVDPEVPGPDGAPTTSPEYVKVREFRTSGFMGRVWRSLSDEVAKMPPKFNLRPDLPGADADGGLIGWRHFLSSNQVLSFAAGVNSAAASLPSADTFRSTTSGKDEILSASPTSGRSHGSSLSGMSSTSLPMTPSTPITPMTSPYSGTPPWAKDTCSGAWNHSHKNGKEWWQHVERERPGPFDVILPKQLF